MLGGAGILLGVAAAPAQAAEVSYKTECVPPPISGLPPVQGTTKVEITAPAEAKVGDEVTITWKFAQAASKNPDVLDLDKDTVKPTGTLKAGGAQTADIAMEGPRQNPAIPKNSDMKLSDMTGRLKLTAAGDVTLTPDAYDINVSKPISTDTKCTPKETVKSSATIKVTGGGGGSGGTTGGIPTTTPTLPTGLPTLPTGSATPSPSGSGTGGGDSGGSDGGGGGQTDFTGKEVSVPYACKTPIGDKDATSPVQINAKKNGGSYDLTVQFKKSVMDSPADIPADSVKPSMEVALGGADKGTVHVEGPTNSAAIKSGDPIEVPDLTGTYKPGATGESTLSPGVLTVKALGTTTTCTPTKSEVSLTLDTSEQASGASGGGSTSSGSGSAGGSGGLAETGSESHSALKALGLVAGTVILLGGAVFTFMPGRRTR
ncbi:MULTISPECIES: hypothetical protein [unclassified Streptomyces]|uniref:hypothetical protein n=1 Tax=unclassified Streptomyces TaxID=2593676 RepID=UPI00225ADF64|nr:MULTISPECIES: hypothetical protein [unclassified Streptomyces]MCX4990459.1 hypothetical protein [Streptomyces sp. NBC_00568]MCX5004310.1 hypothetical protein [Streptomyces sp. NBC_00638]